MTTEHVLVPLPGGSLDSNQPYGGEGAPVNRPPTIVSPVPFLTGQVNTAFFYDMSVHFTDPDGDPLTYSGTAPPGLVVNADGTVTGSPLAEGTTNGNTIRATDPGGLFAEQTYSVQVTAAPEPPPSGHPNANVLNWPNMTSGVASNGFRQVVGNTAPFTQQLISWRVTGFIWQGGVGATTQQERRNYRAAFEEYRQNRIGRSCWHLDCHGIQGLNEPPRTNLYWPIWKAAVDSNGQWIVRDANGHWLGRSTSASSGTARRMSMDHTRAAFNQYMADVWMDWLFASGDQFLGDTVDCIHHDAMTSRLRRKYATNRHNVVISNINGARDEITIPDWPGMPLEGDPDGEGFETVNGDYFAMLYIGSPAGGVPEQLDDLAEARTFPRGKRSGGDLILKVNPKLTSVPQTGWRCQIMQTRGNTSSADLNRNGFNNNDSVDHSNPNSEPYLRTNGYKLFFETLDNAFSASRLANDMPAFRPGPIPNGVSGSFLDFNGGRIDMRTHGWRDAQSWGLSEHIEDGLSDASAFTRRRESQGYNYRVKKERDHLWYFGRLYWGETHLNKTQVSDLGFSKVTGMANVNSRSPRNDWTEIDHAFMAFYHMYCVMGGNGYWSFAGHHELRQQVMSVLLNWNPLGAPIDPATFYTTKLPGKHRFIDAVDESVLGLDAFTLRPNDWGQVNGTGQYEAWWPDDSITIWSMRRVVNDVEDWMPSWMTGGQSLDPAKDYYQIHGLPDGVGLYKTDWSTYINPVTGENAYEGLWAGNELGKLYPLFESDESTPAGMGPYLGTNGDLIGCGPGEFNRLVKGPIL